MQSAKSFANNLDINIDKLASDIATGKFRFSKLKPFRFPKGNSGKFRLICVPTVKDRLVQRCIADYLESKEDSPVYNSVSYGFIKGQGTHKAMEKALELRQQYPYVFETDITKFFDNIPRLQMKKKITHTLGQSNITPLLHNLVDVEAKENANCTQKMMEELGVFKDKGLRQGMPLSPFLANLILSNFDKQIVTLGIPMVRYVDDFILFAHSKSEATKFGELARNELLKLGLELPLLEENGKTKITAAQQPFEFLGIEIYFDTGKREYRKRLSKSKIAQIIEMTRAEFTLENALKEGWDLGKFTSKLTRRVSSYEATYGGLDNYNYLRTELSGVAKELLRELYIALFGYKALQGLAKNKAKFLGIDTFQLVDGEVEPV